MNIAAEKLLADLEKALCGGKRVTLVCSNETLDVGPIMKEIDDLVTRIQHSYGSSSTDISYDFPIVADELIG